MLLASGLSSICLLTPAISHALELATEIVDEGLLGHQSDGVYKQGIVPGDVTGLWDKLNLNKLGLPGFPATTQEGPFVMQIARLAIVV